MKAAIYSQHGNPTEVVRLETVEKPIAKAHQVIVRVSVAAANPVDLLVIAGRMSGEGWETPLPHSPGFDFSGVVDSVGESVTLFKVGDRVAAVNWGPVKYSDGDEPIAGTFAEYLAISEKKLSLIPTGFSDDVAASVQLVGTTAYESLFNAGKLKKDDKILILGGSSAVGSVAIQLAKNVGAFVATTASTKNLKYVSQYNPDIIIDYSVEKWEEDERIRNFDMVFDTVGEVGAFSKATSTSGLLRSYQANEERKGAVYVTIVNGEAGYNPTAHPPLSFASFFCLSNSSQVQSELMNLIVEGKLKVVVEDEFAFTNEGLAKLFEKQASKKSLGKNILRIA